MTPQQVRLELTGGIVYGGIRRTNPLPRLFPMPTPLTPDLGPDAYWNCASKVLASCDAVAADLEDSYYWGLAAKNLTRHGEDAAAAVATATLVSLIRQQPTTQAA